MSTAQFPDFSPPIVNGIYEVASHHVGKSIVDLVRNCFTSGKIRRGHYYYGRVHPLIQQHYTRLEPDEQNHIDFEVTQTSLAREKMERAEGSIFQKYSLAKDYKRVAKHLFIVVETASRRATERHLMAQISEALAARAARPMETISAHSNPFSDSHAAPMQVDVDVGNLNQVGVSTYHSETRGEAAVVLGLQDHDGTTQEVLAMIPLEVISGDRADEGAETATMSSYESHGAFGPPTEGPPIASGDVGQ